ncbi:rap1 GTPase-GDP dissociation stimulator 1-B-like [Sycon ciliatum]|uniref:rap1 GTPase-GDP dissociation stimulator 1-B-like n=1 Tax=Sycon ciliatum TaxID=27933 RepID=UPI0020ABE250|eukprot:scpid40935/ scgid16998/ Rap1 GTPase-GDP dissociation stimulator 1-A; RalB-binding protein A; XsmgGDS-A
MAGLSSLSSALESIDSGNEEKVQDALVKILSECDSNNAVGADLINCGIMPALAALVNAVPACQSKIADLVATLARTETARSPAVHAGLVPLLVDVLRSDDKEKVKQSLRALGNICFDNDEGREALLRADGVVVIGGILEDEAKDETVQEERLELFRPLCGCVLNMMTGYDAVAEACIEADIPNSIVQIIRHHGSTDIGLCRVLIMTLDSILEGAQEPGANALREAGAVTVIVRLLGAVEDSSVKELIIETLASAAQNELWQLALAAQGCVSHLLRQFQLDVDGAVTLTSDVSRKVMDLIVMLLTGDESLRILFSQGNGPILPVVCNWLKSSDEKVLSSGALAIGNMARSDTNCSVLLEKGVLALLLAVLEKYSSKEDNVEVLHGALSAIRNLSMPAASKEHLASKDVPSQIVPLVYHVAQPVQQKSLGALRLMVDGQESVATALGSQAELAARLVDLSSHPDIGVSSEAQRLIASLIKNSRTDTVGSTFLAADVVKSLAALGESQHVIMVHEAIMACNILVVACKDSAPAAMRDGGVQKIATDIANDPEVGVELKSNAQTLVDALR